MSVLNDDEIDIIRSVCPHNGNEEIVDSAHTLFFRLSPEVSPYVRVFLETRGWVDLSYRQLHPLEPCKNFPPSFLKNGKKHVITALQQIQKVKNGQTNAKVEKDNGEVLNISKFAFGMRSFGKPKRDTIYYQSVPAVWNQWWEDTGFTALPFTFMNSSMILNHQPALSTVYRKDNLSSALKTLLQHYPGLPKVLPETFLVPAEDQAFQAAVLETEGTGVVWIAKPVNGARGQGIFLFQTLAEVMDKWSRAHQKAPFVMQKYIQNPLLQGTKIAHKFDLRLYVLVETAWPFKLHIHQRGIVRLSSQPYNDDFSNTLAHLTNFSLNEGKESDSSSDHITEDLTGMFENPVSGSSGCKWTLESFWEYLATHTDLKKEQVWHKIKRAVLLSFLPVVASDVNLPNRTEYDIVKDENPDFMKLHHINKNLRAYELLGVDIMIMEDGSPIVIELNRSPAMKISTKADRQVKTKMLHDTFNMLDIESTLLAAKRAHSTNTDNQVEPNIKKEEQDKEVIPHKPTVAWQYYKAGRVLPTPTNELSVKMTEYMQVAKKLRPAEKMLERLDMYAGVNEFEQIYPLTSTDAHSTNATEAIAALFADPPVAKKKEQLLAHDLVNMKSLAMKMNQAKLKSEFIKVVCQYLQDTE